MLRPLHCTLLFCLLLAALAEKKKPAPGLRPAAVTQAQVVFLAEVSNDRSVAAYDSFRTTLESTHRFCLAPTPLGADLLIVFSSAAADFNTGTSPQLTLTLRDPHSAAIIGTVAARWAALPNPAKNAEAVTRLLNALFALDASGPPPAFQATLVPEISTKSRFAEDLHQALVDVNSSAPPLAAGIGTAVFLAAVYTSGNFDKTMKAFAGTFDKRVQEVTKHP